MPPILIPQQDTQITRMESLFYCKQFLKIGRLNRPIGIWLLWAPTAWALWIAYQGKPSLDVIILFFLGTVVIRTAGCVLNDIVDRDIDLHVKRTQDRPLTAGRLSLRQTLGYLLFLLTLALIVVLQLQRSCLYYAFIGIAIITLYPFCKRFLKGPQLILGLAFSLGIPMAYAQAGQAANAIMFLMMLINFFWTIAYDTQYAMADKEDDLKIGVKSTAIWFGRYDKSIITVLQFLSHSLWLIIATKLRFSPAFYGIWAISGLIFVYQRTLLTKKTSEAFIQAFGSNAWYGLLVWLGIIVEYWL